MLQIWLAQAQAPAEPLQPLPSPALPEVFIPPAPVPVWMYVGAALLLVVMLSLVLWLLLRPRGPLALAPKRPWKEAMAALKNLSARARGQTPAEVATQVSEILRRYFLGRYRIPAPFRTTREIFKDDGSAPASARLQRYAPLAALWDELSFAPAPASDEEVMELLARAMTYLEEDHPAMAEAADVEARAVANPVPNQEASQSLRWLLQMAAAVYLLAAAGGVSLLFFHDDAQRLWWGIVLAAVLAAIAGFRYLYSAMVPDPHQKQFGVDPDRSLEDQISGCERRLVLVPLVILPLTAWMIYLMEKVASGDEASPWEVSVVIYDLLGYWGAALVFPIIGMISLTLTLTHLNLLKLHSAHSNRPAA